MARKKFSCDFETTTKTDDCRVWAYGYMQIGKKSNYKIGNSLDEFMEWAEEVKSDLYFHNLKFDGSFIVNWLLKNGFTHSENPKAKTFNTTISGMGQWYIVDICYGYKGNKKQHTVIYDSLKKLPFPVKKIAVDFKLPLEKGDIDYHTERPIGHVITDEEYKYIKNDIEIIADALEIQFKQGLIKMTNGSDSLNDLKNILSKKTFENHFPVFSLEMDNEVRLAYRGGFTWLNEKWKNKIIHHGMVFDVNSLYPSQMYDKMLPYGYPIFFNDEYETDENYPLYIQKIRCEFYLKEDKIPTIQIKGDDRFKGTEYLKNSKGESVELVLTNIDLELIKENYDMYDVEYLGGWKFKAKSGLFKQFIDKWTLIKINPDNDGAIKLLAKLMLNALYGKFATNPDITGKIPYLKDDGSIGFRMGDEEFKDPVYTPMGVFITSYARELTIRTAQSCYERIIYCDTDSIHLTGTEIPESIKHLIHDDNLGMWQHESTFKRAKYIRQKTYIQELYEKQNAKGKWVRADESTHERIKTSVKCAGMPDNIKKEVTFDNFEIGFSAFGKLVPKQVDGGVVLVDSIFTIKEGGLIW